LTKVLFSWYEKDKPTRYAKYWLYLIATKARDRLIITNQKTEKDMYELIILSTRPLVVISTGHGLPDSLLDYKSKPALKAGMNEDIMDDKIVFIVSCFNGQILAPALVSKGARAVIAFADRLQWVIKPPYNPAIDNFARPIGDSIVALGRSLVSGNTVRESVDKARRVANSYLEKWEKSEEAIAPEIISTIACFNESMVVLGDSSARLEIKPRERPRVENAIIAALLAAIGGISLLYFRRRAK